MLQAMFVYPVAFCALGLIACVLGIGWLLARKNVSDHPHKAVSYTHLPAPGSEVAGGRLFFMSGTPCVPSLFPRRRVRASSPNESASARRGSVQRKQLFLRERVGVAGGGRTHLRLECAHGDAGILSLIHIF